MNSIHPFAPANPKPQGNTPLTEIHDQRSGFIPLAQLDTPEKLWAALAPTPEAEARLQMALRDLLKLCMSAEESDDAD